jgi:hypothetical protein
MADDRFILRVLRKIILSEPSPLVIEKIERLAIKLGMDEKELMKLYVEMKNKFHRDRFAEIDYSDRILLLPQCLRDRSCDAELTEYGYDCGDCDRCKVADIKRVAEELGYRVFILPGGAVVEKILRRFRPKAVLGVACMKELVLGNIVCEKVGIPAQGVALLRDGCVGTDVDLDRLRDFLLLS